MAATHMGASKHGGCPNMRGIQTYRGNPNVWGHMDNPLVWQSMLSLCCVCMGASKHYPNIQGVSKHVAIQTYRGCIKTYGGIQTYRGCPNIKGGIQTYGCCPNMEGIQTYRVHPHIWGHPNVFGHMDNPLVWHSMFSMCCVCTGGIQTSPKHTTGYSNIWGMSKHEGHPNIQGESKCMGAYGHSLSATKHAFFVLCMYGGIQTLSKHTWGVQTCGHPNIQGMHQNIWWHPNIQGSIQNIWVLSKHGGIQTYRVHPHIWGHMDTPLVWHSMLSMCCVCTGGIQNITQTYNRVFKHMGVSKHDRHPNIGGIQTYRGCPHMWGHSNIKGAIQTYWGCPTIQGLWTPLSMTKLALCCVCTGGIQTYGGIQTCGRIQTYGSVHTYSGGIQT